MIISLVAFLSYIVILTVLQSTCNVINMGIFLGFLIFVFSFMWFDGLLIEYLTVFNLQDNLFILVICLLVGLLLLTKEVYIINYGVLLSLTLGLLVIVMTDSWLSIYLGLELVSLSMVLFLRSNNLLLRNIEAMIKYLIVASVSSGIFLLGVLIIYWNTGSLSLSFTVFSYVNDISIAGLGLDIVYISLLVKLGSWPVCNWQLDVLSGVNSKQGLLLTTLSKIGSLYLLIELGWVWWFYIILLGSLITGLLGLMSEVNIGRFIGYSGLVSDALLIYSLSLVISKINLYIYIVVYFLTLWLLWGLPLTNKLSTVNVKGIYGALVLLSLGGLPPLLGFYTKWWLLSSIFFEGSYWLSLIVLFSGIWLLIIYGSFIGLFNEQRLSLIYFVGWQWKSSTINSWLWLLLLLGVFII